MEFVLCARAAWKHIKNSMIILMKEEEKVSYWELKYSVKQTKIASP